MRIPLSMLKLRVRRVHPELVASFGIPVMSAVQLTISGTCCNGRWVEPVRLLMMMGLVMGWARMARAGELLLAVGMRCDKLGVRAELVASQMCIPPRVRNMHVARVDPKSVSP